MNLTSAAYLKQLKTLHKALLIAAVIFSSVVVIIINKTSDPRKYNGELHQVFMFLAPVLAIACILLSTYLYKKSVDAINENPGLPLAQKLVAYQTACIRRWASLEAAMLFCTIALFLTGKYYYIIFLFLLLTFFIMYAPGKEQLITHLQLNLKDRLVMEDEYAEIN